MEKLCTKCSIIKSNTEFYKEKKGKYGTRSNCKTCSAKVQKKYRKTSKNIEYEKEYRKKYLSSFDGTVAKLFASAKKRAKKNNLEFSIDSSWVSDRLIPMVCEVTGSKLTLSKDTDYQHNPFRPSIDRLDNNKGYTKGNSQIVCVIYNKAKCDSLPQDVVLMAQYIVGAKNEK